MITNGHDKEFFYRIQKTQGLCSHWHFVSYVLIDVLYHQFKYHRNECDLLSLFPLANNIKKTDTPGQRYGQIQSGFRSVGTDECLQWILLSY